MLRGLPNARGRLNRVRESPFCEELFGHWKNPAGLRIYPALAIISTRNHAMREKWLIRDRCTKEWTREGGIGVLMVERRCYGAYDEGYAPRAFRGSGTPTRMGKGFFVLLCLNPSLDE